MRRIAAYPIISFFIFILLLPGINEKYRMKRDTDCSVATEELIAMNNKIAPIEPEHVSCDTCMKEVPIDEANSFEAVDYVVHFCGLECFEKWKKKEAMGKNSND